MAVTLSDLGNHYYDVMVDGELDHTIRMVTDHDLSTDAVQQCLDIYQAAMTELRHRDITVEPGSSLSLDPMDGMAMLNVSEPNEGDNCDILLSDLGVETNIEPSDADDPNDISYTDMMIISPNDREELTQTDDAH